MRKSYLFIGGLVVILAFALFSHSNAPYDSEAAGTDASAHPSSGSATGPKHDPGSPITPASFYTPKKLKPGERPPQFIVISFDGAGWHEKWDYWNSIAKRVPLRFTGFLTGLYLLDEQHKDAYRGPGHSPGRTSLGTWNSPSEVVQEIKDLNAAWRNGNEIGTHFNGHFCSDNPPGANDWTTADWNNELDQFFTFLRRHRSIDGLPDAPKLQFPADSVSAERTPCLEGVPEQLYPALQKHGISVDSSVTRRGLSWPTRNADGVWQMGMATFPLHGTDHFVTTMDYNFWYTQAGAQTESPDEARQSSTQVENTYLDMYHAAYQGNRAPLILGNHFNSWNHNAYTDAVANFALKTCGEPDTYCVPFRDVVRWMKVQDPATLERLQALPPELAAP